MKECIDTFANRIGRNKLLCKSMRGMIMHNVLVGFVFFDHNHDGALRKERMLMMCCVVCEPHTHGERESKSLSLCVRVSLS